MLASCSTGRCTWGGVDEAHGAYCARINFGEAGAAFLQERATRCGACAPADYVLDADWEFCALACPEPR